MDNLTKSLEYGKNIKKDCRRHIIVHHKLKYHIIVRRIIRDNET